MYCRSINSTFVCTGQRLVRARVVLSSAPGLASIKHFAIFPSDTYSRGVLFHLGYSFSFRHVFLQPEPTLDFVKQKTLFYPSVGGSQKRKRQHVSYVRVIRVHIHIYST